MANPEITNITHRTLKAGDNEFITAVLANGESVVENHALGIVTSSSEYAKLQSAAVDGSQLIRGFAAEAVNATGGASSIRVLVGGFVDQSQIVFDGADTLATVPTGEDDSYEVALRDYGMSAKTLDDHYKPDNQ